MKIAITGAKGMLSKALIPWLKDHELLLIDLPEVDVTNHQTLEKSIDQADFVFHFAAYTDVDGAESEAKKAFAVNEQGSENVAKICNKLNIPLLYLSTDYVFSGNFPGHPWQEQDKPEPQGVYARSKLAGEEAVKKHCKKYFIVRTAWLFGKNGKNFVDTMLKTAIGKKEFKIVNDQKGTPTYTKHLAKALAKFLDIKEYGVYHLTNSGETTWYDFAKMIFDTTGVQVKLIPCRTQDFPRPAPRPAYSVLADKKWRSIGQKPLPPWEKGLQEYLKEIKR